jgi:hypothetical protein
LIIAGTSINESLDEQIKVTVIATGFNGVKRKLVETEESDERGDIISYDEWIKMRKGVSAANVGTGTTGPGAPPAGAAGNKGPGDFLVGRNSKEADLNVPTVIREKKYLQQGDG